MSKRIEVIRQRIAGLQEEIVRHPLYSHIQRVEDLQVFMQHHVYAVWDFMSLLKALQLGLTCVALPWRPVGNAATRYLINEIVTGEESDLDPNGTRKSHFELYLDAMEQAGALPGSVNAFIDSFIHSGNLEQAFEEGNTPLAAREFVRFTFDVIRENKLHNMAAVFTFGREDLIPDMFYAMVKDLDREIPGSISTFTYYLERHIEVDGDHHSKLAIEMTEQLCGTDDSKWKEAEELVLRALEMRKQLWDGAYKAIMERNAVAAV